MLQSNYIQMYWKGKTVIEKYQRINHSEMLWDYRITKGESCSNVGHFYTEHFPNLHRFRKGIKKICVANEVSDSMKELVNEIIPGVVWSRNIEECSESNSPAYSCFMVWECEPHHHHLLFGLQEMWEVYDSLIDHCKSKSVETKAKILLMNRLESRSVKNYHELEDRIKAAGYSFIHVNSREIKDMTQCEIFRLYASVQLVIMPYGADQIYPLLLQKKLLTFMHRQGSEGFWDTTRHVIGRFQDYKTLSVNPYEPDKQVAETHGYTMYSSIVYHDNDLLLSGENLNDTMVIIRRMLR